ncbi:hypothetical protein NUW58_g2733 [Xylaria curta]|uniref:Uncharacterized protein n=1 Tax=Xylaria curta TaxID=42375 RepID=A0ACC1PGT2_9PEZI|nr:hypothetical protein NUW58_g2733 [Xylaria curta]
MVAFSRYHGQSTGGLSMLTIEERNHVEEAAPLVRTFIDRQAASIHPVVAVPSHFVEAKQEYVLREDHNELEDALDEYVGALREAKFQIEFDPKNCTWQDVLDQLYKAEQESNLKQKSWHRKTRRVVAKVGDDISPWLKLIPNENGLSVLNGGLAVFFHAARRAENNRDDLLEAFKEIPVAIQKAADKSAAFPSDVRLKNSVNTLYRTVLQELPHLIELLLHRRPRNKLLAPLRTQSTSTNIGDRVKRIKRTVAELDDVMTTLTQLTTVETLQNVKENVKEIHGRQEQSAILQIALHQENMSKQEQWKNEILDVLGRGDVMVPKNALKQLLTEQVRAQAQGCLEEMLKEVEEQRHRATLSYLSPNDILDILQADIQKPTRDLSYVLRQDNKINERSKGQARYLTQREEFKEWFFSFDPDLLVVNGNLETSSSKVSSLSLVCAEMVKFLEGVDNEVVLYFFCSENLASENSLSGPQKIMRGLVAQLLAFLNEQKDLLDGRNGLNLAFMESQRWQKRLESLDLRILCDSFWNLLQQMRAITLFCVVDGMSLYEREDWRDDVLFLIRELEEMVCDGGLRPRLKVLITYTTRAIYLDEGILRVSLRPSETSQRRVSERFETSLEDSTSQSLYLSRTYGEE